MYNEGIFVEFVVFSAWGSSNHVSHKEDHKETWLLLFLQRSFHQAISHSFLHFLHLLSISPLLSQHKTHIRKKKYQRKTTKPMYFELTIIFMGCAWTRHKEWLGWYNAMFVPDLHFLLHNINLSHTIANMLFKR